MSRSDRVAKYNQLIRIEENIGTQTINNKLEKYLKQMKKILFVLGILVLGNLHYSIIFKNNNISDFLFLNQQNNKLIDDIKKITIKNSLLEKEIKALSLTDDALENFARYNLGLVKKDETFVQVIQK